MHLLFLLIFGSVLFCLSGILYRLFFHPLAGIPGPRLGAVTNLWYAYQVRRGRLFRLATTLHKQYGPVVRVRPNELWFDSPEAFKLIYNPNHGFEKSDFYLSTLLFRPATSWRHPSQLQFADTFDLLSERDLKLYRWQRRLMRPVYHESNIRKFSRAVDAVMKRAVKELRTLEGQEIHLKEWMHIVALECLGAVVLDWSPGYLKDHSDHDSSNIGYYNWRRKSVLGLFPFWIKADLHLKWVGKIFTFLWRLNYETREDFKPLFPAIGQKVANRIRRARKMSAAPIPKPNPKTQSRDLMEDLIKLHRENPAFTDIYLRRLAVTNFGAGHETMCSALTAIMSMIASHRDVFQAVSAEIRQAKIDANPVVCARDVAQRMPLTWASIKEAQRLHPALGMALPRMVPIVWDDLQEPFIHLHGYRIPAGTVVGCCPAALHRNEQLFGPDAAAFRPQRWLECDAAKRRMMDRCNLTWGGGPRTCPGRYLAEMVVYKVVIGLIRAFDVEASLPPENDIKYYFLAMLTGAKATFYRKGTFDHDEDEE